MPDPSLTKLRTEQLDPRASMSKMEDFEPNRQNDLTDTALPSASISNTEALPAILANDLTENVDPMKAH